MLDYRHGHLHVRDLSLRAAAGELVTPFFLVDADRLRENHRALRAGLTGEVPPTLRFCVKTNPEAGILRILAREGCHVMAAHPAEVTLALGAGVPPERIAYQRPILTAEDLDRVLGAGVRMVHVHRPEDVALLEDAGVDLRVSLRLAVDGRSPAAFLFRRLGLRGDEAETVGRAVLASRRLTLAGVNFYVGTQQRAPAGFHTMIREAVRVLAALGGPPAEINLGGGIPGPGVLKLGLGNLPTRWRDTPRPSAPDTVGAFARALAERVRVEAARVGLAPPPLALEPGRSLVGDAVVLVTRVVSLRAGWVFLDASDSYAAESPLFLSKRVLPVAQAPAVRRAHLCGSSLNLTDVIDVARRLPALAVGDLLALCDAGAYSMAWARRYADLPPAVHLLDGGTVQQLRPREQTLP